MKRSLLANKPTLKVCSLIFGYTLWALISNHHVTTRTITVPVCFNAVPANLTLVNAPDTIAVSVRAPRKDLLNLAQEPCSLQIDGRALAVGANSITLQREKLVLPERIKVVHYSPRTLTITTKQRTT